DRDRKPALIEHLSQPPRLPAHFLSVLLFFSFIISAPLGESSGILRTARIQRGASETARWASTGVSLSTRPYSIPAFLFADSTVLSSSIAIVIGPTPPGTGLIHPAFWLTDSKSTSPQSFPSGNLFVPTSITMAPSFTMSAVTNFAFPIATN